MKKAIALLAVVIMLCLTMACTVSAEEAAPTEPTLSNGKNTSAKKAMPLAEAGVVDALNKDTAERWYAVDITVAGDAVLIFDSSAYTYCAYCWECTFIDQDKTTELSTLDVGARRDYLSITNLQVGTYYLRVRKVQKEDPPGVALRYGFCDGQYTLRLVTCATPVAVDPATHTVSKAGDLLCVVDGHLFLKAYDGEAVAGAYITKEGEAGPLLLSRKGMECVAYFSSATNTIHQTDRSTYVNHGGMYGDHYTASVTAGFVKCSDPARISDGVYVSAEGKAAGLERAGKELINVHLGNDPLEGLKWDVFMESKAAPWVFGGIVVVVIAIIVVAHTVSNNSRYRGKVYSYDDDPPSYTPPSSSSDGTWYDGKPWTANHANAKDM